MERALHKLVAQPSFQVIASARSLKPPSKFLRATVTAVALAVALAVAQHLARMNILILVSKAKQIGLTIPATLISNSPEQVIEFAQSHQPFFGTNTSCRLMH